MHGLVIGDPSDGLTEKKFITYNELRVQLGALMMYTVQVQYKKYISNYYEWMCELTMFLMKQKDNNNNDQLDDDLDNNLFSEFNEMLYSEDNNINDGNIDKCFSSNNLSRYLNSNLSVYYN